jgi:hypothetical protein
MQAHRPLYQHGPASERKYTPKGQISRFGCEFPGTVPGDSVRVRPAGCLAEIGRVVPRQENTTGPRTPVRGPGGWLKIEVAAPSARRQLNASAAQPLPRWVVEVIHNIANLAYPPRPGNWRPSFPAAFFDRTCPELRVNAVRTTIAMVAGLGDRRRPNPGPQNRRGPHNCSPASAGLTPSTWFLPDSSRPRAEVKKWVRRCGQKAGTLRPAALGPGKLCFPPAIKEAS